MKKTTCRLCKSENLVEFLNLGHHPHSDNFRKDKDLPETTYPLTLNQCQDCQFVQLGYTVSPEVLYDADYLYESSITKTADKHWTEFVESVINSTGISSGKVLDIGSNDGTLLSKFKARGFDVQGIDPCDQIAEIARQRGIPTVTSLFTKDSLTDKYDLITGSNVFAHIDDLDAVIEDVKALLNPNGVFIFESPYLGDFIDQLEYSTVYHQHLSYLAIKPLVSFLDKFDMEIFNVEFSDIHGGCFRCYISRKGQSVVSDEVTNVCNSEDYPIEFLKNWGIECKKHSDKLFDIVYNLYKDGKVICCVSSPAKGMTQLNYTNINRYISFITERSKLKQGRYTPGGHIEIVGDDALIAKKPDVAILLAWNFSNEIIKNNSDYKGIWIIPDKNIQIIHAKE